MKNLLKLTRLSLLLFIGFSIQSCSDDDDNTTISNIVEIAMGEPDLSNLVAALSAADGNLVNVLSGGEFTVLAPTNQAFETFLTANGFMSLSDVPTDVLSNILLNHVITGTVNSTDLVNAGSGYRTTNASNMNGDNLSLYFDTTSGVTFNGVSSVATANIVASNGIIHIVDEVIGLPTIATLATANDELSTLVDALNYADTGGSSPTIQWISTISDATAGPFTVFAPVNNAFLDPATGVLAELSFSGFGEGAGELSAATTDAVLLM
ncbi:MAG: fasciclin domain-containing protein, partial [Flavobacteriaceae bacterium]